MTLRSKLLVSSLLAISALSSAFAINALADTFKVGSNPVQATYNTSIAPEFTFTPGKVACKGASGTGTISSSETSEIEMTPTFSECTGLGFPVTPHLNGCWLSWRVNAATTGNVDIQCAPGKELTFTALGAATVKCTIHVPPQAGLATVTYKNLGAGVTSEVQAELKLENVKYSHTAGTGVGACTSGKGVNGGIEWTVLITGEHPTFKNHIGIWLV